MAPSFTNNKLILIMEEQSSLELVRNSFETWYNDRFKSESPTAILINYKDEQKLSIKSYHTTTIEISAVKVGEKGSEVVQLIKLKNNYNNGVTTAQEAKNLAVQQLLVSLYNYKR
jgi:hypothetical protein